MLISWERWGTENRIEKAISILDEVSKSFVYNYDSYSWLLSILFTEITRKYIRDSLWKELNPIKVQLNQIGMEVLDNYAKVSFLENKMLVWPSQKAGIVGILSGESFALCTPTGSGKTRVAELAILNNLFSDKTSKLEHPPVILYLAPSRALSAEVESVLSKSLRRVKAKNVKVTAFYGGHDFGPSDFMSIEENPTVLISTHEKIEALLRFYGPHIIKNITCVIIDEAHIVSFTGNITELAEATNRSLKLESLISRLKALCSTKTTFIALSAVASEIKDSLSAWMSGKDDNPAISPSYRSTRQLFGKLICYENGSLKIEYDVLDGQLLFIKNSDDAPYIPNPFVAHPEAIQTFNKEKDSIEKRMRAHLLWSAMNFAQLKEGRRHSVLISITEHIEWYSGSFVDLLEKDWKEINLPDYFQFPQDEKIFSLYNRCLESCIDYFGKESREFKLLSKGIIVHHGKMPSIMSRLLIELIQTNSINIVLATSTLSEGVNLPFETVLIPSLFRGQMDPVNPKEMANVSGRAGRPGISTEGRTLILLPERDEKQWRSRARENAYKAIVNSLIEKQYIDKNIKISPLINLLDYITVEWQKLTKETVDLVHFINWLECTTYDNNNGEELQLLTALDSFDQILLTAIEEAEEIEEKLILEDFLKLLWKSTLAAHTTEGDAKEFYETIFVKRGMTLNNYIYNEKSTRHEYYYIGLPPRDCISMIEIIPRMKELFFEASNFAIWNSQEKVSYFIRVINSLREVSSFSFAEFKGKTSWTDILSWWLSPNEALKQPTYKSVSNWYSYASTNFIFKMNWALGSILGYILENDGGEGQTLVKWKKSGLPWALIWFKELITWGTLDPVVSFAMSNKLAFTRSDASIMATKYWKNYKSQEINDDSLDPRKISDWLSTLRESSIFGFNPDCYNIPLLEIKVNLVDDFSDFKDVELHVFPITNENTIFWIDPAGFKLAKSEIFDGWTEIDPIKTDFLLVPNQKKVYWRDYI